MKNKRAMEMGFNWLFAIIAGVFILFLAIYGASKFIGTQEKVLYTETAAKMISLFDPMETGLASGKSIEIGFIKQSRFYFECEEDLNKPFGKQRIAFSEQTFGKEFGEKSQGVDIDNKYVFVEDVIEGKKLYLFSKPFFMGFKVADIVIISSDDYCFYNSPEYVVELVEDLNLEYINISDGGECDGINVCFDSSRSDCSIKVSTVENFIQKQGKKMYYVDDLLYAGIFSSPEIYECNVKRLKNKFDKLAEIYIDKIDIIERKGCSSTIQSRLEVMLGEISSSRDMVGLFNSVNDFDLINDATNSECRLY